MTPGTTSAPYRGSRKREWRRVRELWLALVEQERIAAEREKETNDDHNP